MLGGDSLYTALYSSSWIQQSPHIILDQKYGDVTGDGIIDTVLLTGRMSPDSPFIQDVTLIVQDGRSMQSYPILFPIRMGYHPTLFLGDFTGDGIDEILVRMDSGGTGGLTYDYLYSFVQYQAKKLFDSQQFSQQTSYQVDYLDHYRVNVRNLKTNQSLILDITWKGKEYLDEIYDSSGKLKAPIRGDVNAIGGLYPIDFNRDGIYDLLGYQRITGRYNADGLGDLQTVFSWNGTRLAPERQQIAIFFG